MRLNASCAESRFCRKGSAFDLDLASHRPKHRNHGDYGTLANVTQPVVNAGYYVFPVAVVDNLMRQNGLPTPHEMHAVPMSKLREIFNPDAVLYLTITDWGSSYNILSSSTTVSMTGRLLDSNSGQALWTGSISRAINSGGGGGGIGGMLANALVSQISNSIADPSMEIAKEACWDLLQGAGRGWILGPYHPDYTEHMAAARAAVQATPLP